MTNHEIYEELKDLQSPLGKIPGYLFWNNGQKIKLEKAFELLKIDLNSIKVTTASGFPVIRKWLYEK